MAQLTVEQIYKGKKYDIMSAIFSDYLKNGKPKDYDGRTWLDLLTVKQSINAANKMLQEGDTVSGMTDDVPPSSHMEVKL